MSTDTERLQAEVAGLMNSLESAIQAAIACGGVKSVLAMLDIISRASIDSADQHPGLARVSGIVRGAKGFIDGEPLSVENQKR